MYVCTSFLGTFLNRWLQKFLSEIGLQRYCSRNLCLRLKDWSFERVSHREVGLRRNFTESGSYLIHSVWVAPVCSPSFMTTRVRTGRGPVVVSSYSLRRRTVEVVDTGTLFGLWPTPFVGSFKWSSRTKSGRVVMTVNFLRCTHFSDL